MFSLIKDTELQAATISKETGFIISTDDINQAQTERSDVELEGRGWWMYI